jgi:hypothetical protein
VKRADVDLASVHVRIVGQMGSVAGRSVYVLAVPLNAYIFPLGSWIVTIWRAISAAASSFAPCCPSPI